MIRRHHLTRNTVEAKAWCPRCKKPTPHRVDDGRIGPCLPCMDEADRQSELRKAQQEEQPKLWDNDTEKT